MIRQLLIAAAAAAAALLPAGASAATYRIQDAYTNSSGVFTVGYGIGNTVNGYQFSSDSCFGKAGFSCSSYQPVSNTSADADRYLPAIGINTNSNGEPINIVDQVFVPTNVLFLHPGAGAEGFDSIVKFTSTTGGVFRVTGAFTRLDGTSNGNGTINKIYTDADAPPALARAATYDTNADNRSAGFNTTFTLGANQSIYFAVNNAGNFQYDSTGLAGTISSVPEPATWGMMIMGLGAVGGTLRRRKAIVRVAHA